MILDPELAVSAVVIRHQSAAQVQSCKCAGVYIVGSLPRTTRVDWIRFRLFQRMYFLHRFLCGVEQKVLLLFHRAVLQSVITYEVTVWFGNLH